MFFLIFKRNDFVGTVPDKPFIRRSKNQLAIHGDGISFNKKLQKLGAIKFKVADNAN